MDRQRLGRKNILLSVLIVVGIAYSGFLSFEPTLTGKHELDGMIGVVLGLYISSHPAAHLVEMFFYRRASRHQFSSKRSLAVWLCLNVLVLLISGIVIFVGTTRLIGQIE
ncbi:MAG TPA: hypothetical protein VMV04_05245 [Thermodesulfobacteriota bacterium]|nr:hypothetical protein [Thermodesulfobacteriota bacterium]